MEPISIAALGRRLPRAVRADRGQRTRWHGLAQRLSVALHRARLDRELAAGIDPAVGDPHAIRAAQLTTGWARRELAATLDLLAQSPDAPPSRFSITPSPAAIDRCRAQIDGLSRRLRGPEPLDAASVAKLILLLRDGTGPLYTDPDGARLRRALADIEDTLSW